VHKVVIHKRGHYDRLRYEQHPSPPLPAGHVRIAVHACGVNYADCIVRMGLYSSAREYVGWPITPGFEVAGVVADVGDGVTGLSIGDPVLAVTRFGGYTDELVVPRHQVWARPQSLSAVEAAAMPAVFLTAWYALVQLARPESGAPILVHSAAGGVGQALVQLARARGNKTVGIVGSSHKIEAVHALDPTAVVVDKSANKRWWDDVEREAPDGYAAIFDANGVSTLKASYRHLAPTGTLVIYGFASMLPKGGKRVSWLALAWDFIRTPRFDPLHLVENNHNLMGFNLSYLFDRVDILELGMGSLLPWFADGTLSPPPVQTFALRDVADAHRAIESGQTVGKLVLTTEHHP